MLHLLAPVMLESQLSEEHTSKRKRRIHPSIFSQRLQASGCCKQDSHPPFCHHQMEATFSVCPTSDVMSRGMRLRNVATRTLRIMWGHPSWPDRQLVKISTPTPLLNEIVILRHRGEEMEPITSVHLPGYPKRTLSSLVWGHFCPQK